MRSANRSWQPPSPPPLYKYLRAISRPQYLLHEVFQDYGDIVRWRGPLGMYLVSHPDFARQIMSDGFREFSKDLIDYRVLAAYLGHGMICSDGPAWQEQRRDMQPFFSAIGRFDDAINDHTSSLLRTWEDRTPGAPVRLDREMSHLMLQLTGSIVLGRNVEGYFPHIDQIVTAFNSPTRALRSLLTLHSWIPTPHNLKWRAARRCLDTAAYDSIAACRHAGARGPDILSHVIRTSDENGDARKTDREIRDEIVTFMLSSFGPTTSALVWSLYLLSVNPHVQNALADKLVARLHGAPATAGDLARIPLLKRVVQESVRLYPPVVFYARRAEQENVFGEHVLPARTGVAVVPYALHRHPDFWPHAERFDPDRFLPENVKTRHFYSYLPFGAGPRVCIGAGLAMRQVQLVLAQIVQRFKFVFLPDQPIDVTGGVTLMPRQGIPVALAAR